MTARPIWVVLVDGIPVQAAWTRVAAKAWARSVGWARVRIVRYVPLAVGPTIKLGRNAQHARAAKKRSGR